jgi:hypothetical protein
MKQYALAGLAFAFASVFLTTAPSARAQIVQPAVFLAGTPPGGIGAACTTTTYGYLTAMGQVVTCYGGVWTVSAGGGGGGFGTSACTTPSGAGSSGAVTLSFTAPVNCNLVSISVATTVTLPTPASNVVGPVEVRVTNVTPTASPFTYTGAAENGLPQPTSEQANAVTEIWMYWTGSAWEPAAAPVDITATPLVAGSIFASNYPTGPPVAATQANVLALIAAGTGCGTTTNLIEVSGNCSAGGGGSSSVATGYYVAPFGGYALGGYATQAVSSANQVLCWSTVWPANQGVNSIEGMEIGSIPSTDHYAWAIYSGGSLVGQSATLAGHAMNEYAYAAAFGTTATLTQGQSVDVCMTADSTGSTLFGQTSGPSSDFFGLVLLYQGGAGPAVIFTAANPSTGTSALTFPTTLGTKTIATPNAWPVIAVFH